MEIIYGIYKESYTGAPRLITPLYKNEIDAEQVVSKMMEEDKINKNNGWEYQVKPIHLV